jgi:hypothetical protein
VNTAGKRILERAVEHLGGAEVVADRLKISLSRLRLYASGEREVPDRIVLRTIDLLMDEPRASRRKA